jgi:inhibitor of growth protein 3
MDTLDQIPSELTKVHSDLNELGAVLYCEWIGVLGTLLSRTLDDARPSYTMGRGCRKGAREKELTDSATLLNLETKLNTLVDWIQDATIGPEQRFQLLQEIAEEAARYKLGGDDKIRVAGGACDGVSGLEPDAIRPFNHPIIHPSVHPSIQSFIHPSSPNGVPDQPSWSFGPSDRVSS